MTTPVTLPLWAFVLILLFAAVTFASHFLFPSVRWFFRRRAQRVIAQLNERLPRPIEPFKLARRYDTIQRLSYDPDVTEAIVEEAKVSGIPENVAFQMAQRYAREIVPSFSATAYFGFGTRAAKWLARSLYKIRGGQIDGDALSEIDPNATVVFVMNHRSNMDYVLVTYLTSRASALSYAVGEWARVWPLSAVIRMMGGYFIRRRSRGQLYRRVLARYVQMATDNGVTQAIYPEGRLSVSGRLGEPKLGLLSYIIGDFHEGEREVVFVPVAINYDRVLEDRVLMGAASAGERRFAAPIGEIIGFWAKQFWLRIRGKFHRFGYAAVSFGAPVSLRASPKDPRALGALLMSRIGDIVPMLPVPMVAQILRDGVPRGRGEIEAGMEALRRANSTAYVHVPRGDLAYAVEVGLRMLCKRGMVSEENGRFVAVPDQAQAMDFYANSISHLVAMDAAAQ